jgi:hypothetical protein
MTTETETPRLGTPTGQMGQILCSHFLVQGLHVAADLGIADLLAKQPKTSDELADSTGAHGPSLSRLLRMLASIGVFRQDASGRFALTPLGGTPCVPEVLARPAIWRSSAGRRRFGRPGESCGTAS